LTELKNHELFPDEFEKGDGGDARTGLEIGG
jgi:hypothetical protein